MNTEIKFRAWDGGYKVYTDGKVVGPSGKALKGTYDRDGYRVVFLYIDRKRQIHAVRMLVAHAFLGKRPKGLVINHKNGNRSDDRAENLEYITSRENTLHGWRVNGRKQSALQIATRSRLSKGESNPKAKLTVYQISRIRDMRKMGFFLKDIAKKYKVSVSQISAITRNKFWI